MTKHKNPTTWPARDDFIKAVLASELPDKAVRALVRLAMYLDPDIGLINPGCATLAKKSHIGERTVYRILEMLERTGWIEIERATGIENRYTLRQPTTATYMAVVPDATTATYMAVVPAASEAEPLPNREGTTAKSEGNHCHMDGSLRAFKSKKEKSKRKNQTHGPPDSDDESFQKFWALYPRRVAKLAARRAFDKAIASGADPDALIAGAQRYAVERAGEPVKFTKHPATWLNAGCYDDEPPGVPIIDEDGNPVGYADEQEDEEEDLIKQMTREAYGTDKPW